MVTRTSTDDVTHEHTAVSYTHLQVGIATGIAGLGAVFQSQIQHKTVVALGASRAGQEVLVRGGSSLNRCV